MRVTLAYELTDSQGGHVGDPDETIELPDGEAELLIREGRARKADDETGRTDQRIPVEEAPEGAPQASVPAPAGPEPSAVAPGPAGEAGTQGAAQAATTATGIPGASSQGG